MRKEPLVFIATDDVAPKTPNEVAEEMVASLILVCSGTTLDRMRSCILKTLNADVSGDFERNGALVGVFGEEFDLLFSTPIPFGEASLRGKLSEYEDKRLLDLIRQTTEVMTQAHNGRLGMQKNDLLSAIISTAMEIMCVRRQGSMITPKEGQVPIVMLQYFEQMDKKKRAVFSIIWRACN